MIFRDELLDDIMKFYDKEDRAFICHSEEEDEKLCNFLMIYYEMHKCFPEFALRILCTRDKYNNISYKFFHVETDNLDINTHKITYVVFILGHYFRFVISNKWNDERWQEDFKILSMEELAEYKEHTKYEPDKNTDDTVMVPITLNMAECIYSAIDCAIDEYAGGNMYYIEAKRKFDRIVRQLKAGKR